MWRARHDGRGAHGAEGVLHLAGDHPVHRLDSGPGGMQRSAQAVGIHGGVRVEQHQARRRRPLKDPIHIGGIVYPLKLLARGLGGVTEVMKVVVQVGGMQAVVDGGQALGAFGMGAAGLVFAALGVGDIGGVHAGRVGLLVRYA